MVGNADLQGLCCAESDETDEQRRQHASSPPPSWEDRAELLPEEQPFGVAWMETGLHAHLLLCSYPVQSIPDVVLILRCPDSMHGGRASHQRRTAAHECPCCRW